MTEEGLAEMRDVDAPLADDQLYRALADATPDLTFAFDSDLNLRAINRAAARSLGARPEELIGKSLDELGIPEPLRRRWRQRCMGVLESGLPAERLLNEFTLADGVRHINETTLRPILAPGGEVLGVQGLTRDITDVKQAEELLRNSEQRYKTLFDSANDGIVVYDLEGRILEANSVTCARVGCGKDEIIGRNIIEFRPGETVSTLAAQARRLHDEGQLITEIDIQTSTGETVPVEVSVRLIEDAGRPVVLSISRDIGERKRAEEELRASEERLRQSQKMEAVGQLAGGIAHDFNNSLTVILGYTDFLLSNTLLDDVTREQLGQVRKSAAHASDLTRQILAYSRRQTLRPKIVSVNQVLEDAERVLRHTLGEKIDVQTTLDPDVGLVEVDPAQLGHVILNLALNARDAMPDGGRLTLATAAVELDERDTRQHPDMRPGGYVMVSVADTGIGMTADILAHLFEPFFTTKEPGKGTGLGLATSYGIIKQSGGNISVHSESGKGSAFKIYLPRTNKPADRASETSDAPQEGPGTARILLVEDESGVRELIKLGLELAGYEVLVAEDAAVALDLLQGQCGAIDLLLTDVVLPGNLQGSDLAKIVQQEKPGIVTLFMSGYPRDTVVHGGHLDEGVNYIEKPFTVKRLTDRIRHVLAGRSS